MTTDFTPPSPTVPDLQSQLIHSMAQKLAAMASAALVTNGFIASSQVAQEQSLIAGVVLAVGSVIWTFVRDYADNRRAKALLAATPPKS